MISRKESSSVFFGVAVELMVDVVSLKDDAVDRDRSPVRLRWLGSRAGVSRRAGKDVVLVPIRWNDDGIGANGDASSALRKEEPRGIR